MIHYQRPQFNDDPLLDNGLAQIAVQSRSGFSSDWGVIGHSGLPNFAVALRLVGVTGPSDTRSEARGRLRVGVGDGVGYGLMVVGFFGVVSSIRFLGVVLEAGGGRVYEGSDQQVAKPCISPAMNVSNTPFHSAPFGNSRLIKITLGKPFLRECECKTLAISLTIRLTPGMLKLVPATNKRSTFPSFSSFRPVPFRSRSTADPIDSP
jgi:hypothetical protein